MSVFDDYYGYYNPSNPNAGTLSAQGGGVGGYAPGPSQGSTGNALSMGGASSADSAGGMGGGMGGASMGSGAGSLIGSAVGYGVQGIDNNQVHQDYQNALDAYAGLTPQKAALAQQGRSAFDSARVDPNDRGAQLQALSQLQEIYQNQGLDAATRAQLNQTSQSNALQAKAAQGKIQNAMQQQGLASSGANIAAQREAAQQASQNNYNAGVNAAALGANRQMQALGGAAQIGGQLQGQDWRQASDRAQAQNAINQFNTGQANQIGVFNAGQGNQMAETKAAGMAGQYGNMANQSKQEGQAANSFFTGQGQGWGSLVGSMF